MIVNTYVSTNGNFIMFSSIRPTVCNNSFAGGRRSRKKRDSFNSQQRSMQTRNGTSSLSGQSARKGSQHDTSLSWSGPYSDEVLNAVRWAPSSAFEILWSFTWAVKMCYSLLNDTFGTSPAINNGYYLVVKIGMDNWLIPAIFSQSVIFCFWWPYRFWGIIRKNKLLLILGTFKWIQGTVPWHCYHFEKS